MCKFFSFRSNGKGKFLYLNKEQRKELMDRNKIEGEYNSPDSHTFITDYYGYKGAKDDLFHRYEYDPKSKRFTVDTIIDIIPDDRAEAEEWVRSLDFSTIEFNPFEECEAFHFEKHWWEFMSNKCYVMCRTKILAEKFLEKCEEKGLTWCSGIRLHTTSNWDSYCEDTYYTHGVRFGDIRDSASVSDVLKARVVVYDYKE